MRVSVDGVMIHARIDDGQSGPWVVLAHGIATDLGLWDGVARLLASRFRVVRYDARGHGESEAPAGPYSLQSLGQDALGLMDALGIDHAHFVGLSMGGMVGLGLALDHPKRLLSLTCCDARASAPPDYRQAWTQRAAAVAERGMEAIVEPSLARWFAAGFREAQPEIAARVAAMVRATRPEGYCGCAAALQELDYGARLHTINIPTLYLAGAEDSGAPPAVMQAMAEATPGARYTEITGAGHLSAIERPQEVAEALLEFLSALAPEVAQ